MMCRRFLKKLISMLLAFSMSVGSAGILTGCGSDSEEIVMLDVYSQLTSYVGVQKGWIADILKEKFHVKLNIIPEDQENPMQDGNLGDIAIWANESGGYPVAVKNNFLYDWNKENLLSEYGSYIKKHMPLALQKNREQTSNITDGAKDTLYGFSGNAATSYENHDSFFYTWDIRWDLYKKLGYPEIKDLDDYSQLLSDMQKLCPTDDSGNKAYAVSLWSDWDEAMVMYVKAMASAYYGYDELGIGLYDPETGKLHDALEENGPYLEMLKFFNHLYQKGLLDPASMTQTYDKMYQKAKNGGILSSIFNYSGSQVYNSKVHAKAGKLMYPMKPKEASPIVYGLNPQGSGSIISIGAETEYPDLCMKIINWLCTPEGYLTTCYGPKGDCWDYDKDNNTYFTDLGKKCQENPNTELGGDYKGSFLDGCLQLTFITWSNNANNPESNGETYNSENWKSNIPKAETDIERDWCDVTGCSNPDAYMSRENFVVSPGTSYKESEKSSELEQTWFRVTDEIKNSSWKAIYAGSDAAFRKIVSDMMDRCEQCGYNDCVSWTANEAAKRKSLEDEIKNNS